MIILTGASGGIGSALLEPLSRLDSVVGTYNRRRPEADFSCVAELGKLNLEAPDEITAFVEGLGDRLSRITVVHLATASIDGLAASFEPSEWDRVLRVNLTGSFLLTKALLPRMIQQRWGRVVHISSVAATDGRVGTVAYSSSKTAVFGMSRVLAKEYARYNITSNALLLGYFEVGLTEKIPVDAREAILDRIPARAFGNVSNIANAVEFLIKSEYVNGSTIPIDGGI